MNTITYPVGNGEITLTIDEADELRKLLQFDYIEHCITNVIENNPDFFHFTSEHPRHKFARKVAEMYDDMVDMYGVYGEALDESVFHIGKHVGVVGDNYQEDFIAASDTFDMDDFWKE